MRVVIAGAGFGGLELATLLSAGAPDDVDVVLIDKADAFVFGYSKLDVMFGRSTLDAVRLPYAAIDKPGVRFVQETITAIDPQARRVTTDAGAYEGDVLVVALGADYDLAATPGLAENGDEFYSVAGAARLTEKLHSFSVGRIVIGVCKRRTSARRRRAKQHCSFTMPSRRVGFGTTARSRSLCRCRRPCHLPPTRLPRCSPRLPSAASAYAQPRGDLAARRRRRARRRQ